MSLLMEKDAAAEDMPGRFGLPANAELEAETAA